MAQQSTEGQVGERTLLEEFHADRYIKPYISL